MVLYLVLALTAFALFLLKRRERSVGIELWQRKLHLESKLGKLRFQPGTRVEFSVELEAGLCGLSGVVREQIQENGNDKAIIGQVVHRNSDDRESRMFKVLLSDLERIDGAR